MGFSFRKSFKVGKRGRVNVSKRGLGASFGIPGLRLGVGSGRRARISGGKGPFRFLKSLGSSTPSKDNGDRGGCCGCLALFVIGTVLVGTFSPMFRTEAPSTALSPDSATEEREPEKVIASHTPGLPLLEDTRPTPPTEATPEPVVDSQTPQQRAATLYPQLGIANSPLNKEFLRRYKLYQQTRKDYFDDSEWPTTLAKESFDSMNAQLETTPTPSAISEERHKQPRTSTQARAFATSVKVTLDVSRPEDLIAQIPIQAEISRGRGEDRIFKWRFDDGSAMVAYFRSAPGYQKGLLLHRVDFED